MPKPNGPQWIDVYHASDWADSPHDVSATDVEAQEYFNTHPDVLHMGTEDSVNDAEFGDRAYEHKYRIPVSHIYPVVFGDSKEDMDDEKEFAKRGGETEFEYSMKRRAREGDHEGLFESIPADPLHAIRNNMVIPYRNIKEAPGEISYMVPKSLITQGIVKYHGVRSRWWVGDDDED